MDATSSFFCCFVFSIAFSLGLVNAYELAAKQTLADKVPLFHKTHLNLEEFACVYEYVCLSVGRCFKNMPIAEECYVCSFLGRRGSRNGKDECCKQFSKEKDTESFTPQILCCYQNINNNIIIITITKQLLRRYYIVKITTSSSISIFKVNPL